MSPAAFRPLNRIDADLHRTQPRDFHRNRGPVAFTLLLLRLVMLTRLLLPRVSHVLALAALFGAGTAHAAPAQINVTRTNLVERWITNLVEVRMPANRFVTEYRTNWVELLRTNVVNIFATNFVAVTRTHTNAVWADVPRTNFVLAYRTNWTTLNLTNWSTVLVFKTNWVNQPVTNTVQIDLPAKCSPAGEAGVARTAFKETLKPSPAVRPASPLAMDARRGSRPVPKNQVDVVLSVRWKSGTGSPLVVQQWRVESDDGSLLCFGQDPQFMRALPLGNYRVEVKAQRDENSPLLAALGTLAVTPRDVSLQQGPAGKM